MDYNPGIFSFLKKCISYYDVNKTKQLLDEVEQNIVLG